MQANGFADVIDSTVAGDTRLNQAYGVDTENAEHVGLVNANSPEFFYSVGSAHAGNVRSTGGETYLESARLAGNLTTTGDVFTDVVDTVVKGNLRVTGAESGSFVCASEIDGAGQCEGATTAAAPALSRSAQVDTDDRKAGILAKIDARTAAGERAAEQAGQAFGG